MIGVLMLLYAIPLIYILLPAYLIAIALSWGQDDVHVGAAWDAAGVTTGSITVPLILALGLGIAEQVLKLQNNTAANNSSVANNLDDANDLPDGNTVLNSLS